MQGVDVMLMMASTQPWFLDFMAQEFYECLIGDKLLDQCKAVVIRIVPWKKDNAHHLRNNINLLTVDAVLTRCGLDKATTIKEKLCKQKKSKIVSIASSPGSPLLQSFNL